MKGTTEVMKTCSGLRMISFSSAGTEAAALAEKSPQAQDDVKGICCVRRIPRLGVFYHGYGHEITSASPDSHELFTNVFVQRWAYEGISKSGKWAGSSRLCL